MVPRKPPLVANRKPGTWDYLGHSRKRAPSKIYPARLPTSLIPAQYTRFGPGEKFRFPTQKPIALVLYLLRTYAREHDVVLDISFGSGTILLAAMQTGRRFIGFERDEKNFRIAADRIAKANAAKDQAAD